MMLVATRVVATTDIVDATDVVATFSDAIAIVDDVVTGCVDIVVDKVPHLMGAMRASTKTSFNASPRSRRSSCFVFRQQSPVDSSIIVMTFYRFS